MCLVGEWKKVACGSRNCQPALWAWVSTLTNLHFGFYIHKIGLMIMVTTVVMNVMCQFNGAKGCSESWKALFLGVLARLFPEDISI